MLSVKIRNRRFIKCEEQKLRLTANCSDNAEIWSADLFSEAEIWRKSKRCLSKFRCFSTLCSKLPPAIYLFLDPCWNFLMRFCNSFRLVCFSGSLQRWKCYDHKWYFRRHGITLQTVVSFKAKNLLDPKLNPDKSSQLTDCPGKRN